MAFTRLRDGAGAVGEAGVWFKESGGKGVGTER